MKKCPFCAEEIQDEAIKCRHCGEKLGLTVSPMAALVARLPRLQPAVVALIASWVLFAVFFTITRSAAERPPLFFESMVEAKDFLLGSTDGTAVVMAGSYGRPQVLYVVKHGRDVRGTSMLDGSVVNLDASTLAAKLDEEQARSQLTVCKSNLRNIATALEMWSVDNSGHFPQSLNQLVPNYLRSLPTCPAAGIDTYSASYKSGMSPDNYDYGCSGHHHGNAGIAEGYPKYNSTPALLERP